MVEDSAPQTARPSWLPDGLEFPGPPSAPLSTPPAAFRPPDGGITNRPWEPQAPPQSLLRKVLLWAGVVLGVGILLFGLLGIIAEAGRQRSGGMAVAVVFVVFGGVILASFVTRLLGFGIGWGPARTALSELGILGCLILLGMTINTIVAVTSPTGSGRYVIPWATVLVVVFRAWRGRWLAAAIIGVAWVVAVLITLTLHA